MGPTYITDLDFADDLALLTTEIDQAQEVLSRLEKEAAKIGLHLNVPKTEVMTFNQEEDKIIVARDGREIKVVFDFKYLGCYVDNSAQDIKVRKALAWSACHKMQKIWKSSLPKKIKIRLFTATVESILLYGCSTWTLTKAMEKSLDRTYTRMLGMALNVSWKEHMTNIDLYGNIVIYSEDLLLQDTVKCYFEIFAGYSLLSYLLCSFFCTSANSYSSSVFVLIVFVSSSSRWNCNHCPRNLCDF